MTNAYITRFSGIHLKAATPFTRKKMCRFGAFLSFSSSASLLTSPIAPLIIRSPSSLVLSASLSPSDAPQRSEEWFALRQDKLTTSTFSTALGFWKGTRRCELWSEKVFATDAQIVGVAQKSAMEWGVMNESTAIEKYKSITGREVDSLGFATHSEERFNWIGASPDGLLGFFPGGGILEVKCPYNKGKPELGLPWSTMPFYYMPQVQGQMEVMDRDWADLYCWTPNGSTIFRVSRDRSYWELIHEILREFWWENVIPAREALLLGDEKKAESFKPDSIHKKTGLAIAKSIQLAKESKLHCREVADHVEFFRNNAAMNEQTIHPAETLTALGHQEKDTDKGTCQRSLDIKAYGHSYTASADGTRSPSFTIASNRVQLPPNQRQIYAVDVAWKQDSCYTTAGWVNIDNTIRRDTSKFRAISPIMAEAVGVLEAMRWMMANNIKEAELQTDSKLTIQHLEGSNPQVSLRAIAKDIRKIGKHFDYICIRYVPRSEIALAQSLAEKAFVLANLTT